MEKQTKWLLCVLAVLFLASMLITVCFATEPKGEPATLSIKSFSLSLENATYINFKVESKGVLDPGTIRILVWHEPPAAYKKGTEALCLSSRGTEAGTGYELFQYNDLGAKDMTKTVYVCAYVNENGQEAYSAPAKFSVVMYAYLKKHAEAPDTDLVALLDSMLAYGAQAQRYFHYNEECLATDAMGEVSVVGGTLSDGFSLGWYRAGATVTLTANVPQGDRVFSHWENSAGESVSTDAVFEAPVVEGDQTYTAVYRDLGASQGLKFTPNNDGTCTVSGIGTCTDGDIVIPGVSPVGDLVTAIGSSAFSGCTDLVSITIPASVTVIEKSAFLSCTSLESVYITDLAAWCRIQFGNYNANPLYGAEKLYLNGREIVGDMMIPEGVTAIPAYAFRGCDKITSITIPAGVTSIDERAFCDCSGLRSITVERENAVYRSEGNCLIETATNTLILGCQSSVIPNYVTDIGYGAFRGCTGLFSITIPTGVKSIGSCAFDRCRGLTSITIPASVTVIENSAFLYCTALESVYITDLAAWCRIQFGNYNSNPLYGAEKLYLNGNEIMGDVVIPAGVTAIPAYAFRGCDKITSITINKGVTSIGDRAFYDCSGLRSITVEGENTVYRSEGNCLIETATDTLILGCQSSVIPDDVTAIGEYAFRGCTGLASITIPDSVTAIGSRAFYGCTGLVSITIPSSVTTIGASAFYGCTGLTSLYYKDTEERWLGISIGSSNGNLASAMRYYYSATQPTTAGNYWCYNKNGEITVW